MNTLDARKTGLFALYASIFLLALNGIFAKAITLDATSITQTRSLVAGVVLFGLLAIQKSPMVLVSFRQAAGVYGLGVLLGLHWITYFQAMQVSTVAIGMLSMFCYPVFTVVLEPMFKKQRHKVLDLVAALIMVFGVFLMVSPEILRGELGGSALQGAAWGVSSALLFAVRSTTQKHLFPHVNSISLMAHQALVIAIMLLPFLDFSGAANLPLDDWLLIVLLGCFSTAIAHTLLSVGLKRLPAKTVGLIGCSTPLAGAALAWFFLDETPQIMVFIGGAVILSVAAWETVTHK